MNKPEESQRNRRVAIIAVHGVANQEPNESNAAIASLLAEHALQGSDRVRYSTFSREEIHVPKRPVHATAATPVQPPTADPGAGAFRLDERREYLDRVQPTANDWELGYQFMRMQLEHYKPGSDRTTYDTSVLRGTREDKESGQKTDVDIFEIYWADLSRLATGPLAFVGSLYQLLLHLATLGRQAVDDAAAEQNTWPWWLIAFCQRGAVRMLTLPIALWNVVLLTVGIGVISAELLLKTSWGPIASAGASTAVIACVIAYRLGRAHIVDKPLTWGLIPLMAAAAGGALGASLVWWRVITHEAAVAVPWWLAGLAIVYSIATAYQRMRPGAVVVALLGYAIATGAFWGSLFLNPWNQGTPREAVESSALFTIQVVFAALRVAWIGLFAFSLLLVVLWPFVRLRTRDQSAWSRANAALRTGRLSLALSTGAFLVVTLVAWSGIFTYGVEKFGTFKDAQPRALEIPVLARLVPHPDRLARLDSITARPDTLTALPDTADALHHTTPEYFQGMIADSLSGATPFSLAAASIGFLLLLWMALPSIRAEKDAPSFCTNRESRRMGLWLSRGLDSTQWVTHLLFAAAFVLPTVFGFFATGISWPLRWTYHMVGTIGAFIAASALIIAGVLVKLGGTALDIMLDVDNYLRATPITSTPRARICERYVSLLRHIALANQGGRRRYDHVIIVAHSLGALISAELLQYLKTSTQRGDGDPDLARFGYGEGQRAEIPISLYTMGNPLRQLLNRFFPHRYRWVRVTPDNGSRPLGSSDVEELNAKEWDRPTAHALGIARWESAYRSGDYVGRSLWTEEWYQRTDQGDRGGSYPEPIKIWPTRAYGQLLPEEEYCIGTGGHTHYWDHTALDIADRLDRLVAL